MTSGALGLSDLGQEELDFSDLFLYNPPDDCDKGAHLHNEDKPPLLVVHNLCADIFSSDPPTAIHTPVAHNLHGMGVEFDTLGLTSRPEAIPARSPLIKITPSGDSLSSQPPEPSPSSEALGPYREQRCVSPASSNSSTGWPVEGCSPSASPCVSPGSGGCGIGLSALELCPGIQGIPGIKGNPVSSAHSSPGASPRTSITEETFLMPQHRAATCPLTHQRSRSASPKGKRPYDQYNSPCLGGTPVKQRSRSPSPIPKTQDQHESYYLYHHQVQSEPQSQSLPQPQTQSQTQHQCRVASPCLEEMLSSRSSSLPRVAASKIAATSEESCMYGQTERQDCAYGEVQGWHAEQGRAGAEVKPNTLHIHPNVCPPPYAPCHGLYSEPPVAPLAPLEWPLPSCSGPYELLIQQQPRSHHRAHYETEGSRGAIKTPVGGHPEVQLLGYRGTSSLGLQIFIGTADERNLKPHAFYQVHRITGKTVTTPSLERMFHGTKVLEIPLEPKSHMRALIDCAGILKLRNADIELRNGETDIGRKNTRVCVVFRVHVPQPGGSFVSLQVASQPIECSQRSAQELPSVERQDLDRCSVLGGQQLVLTGQNFTSDSRVIFSEKTQDGQQIWEVESTVDRDKTKPTMLFVEVPPYRDPTIYHPAKVNFYVINGKKKRSQPQHFIYTPLIAIKTEPLDSYTLYGCDPFGISPKSFHDQPDPNSHSRGLSLSPPPHHLANPDHGIMPKYLDGPSLFYSSRVNSSPVLYHAPNQQHGFSGDNLAGGFPAQGHDAGLKPFLYPSLVSHLSGGHCANTAGSVSEFGRGGENHQAAAASLSQGNDLFAACLVPRHQGHATSVESLGSSPPLKYTQRQSHPAVKPGSMAALCGQLLSPRSPTAGSLCEKLEVKQENHSQVYLEDVNDIIRRDMKAHSGDGP